MDFVRETRHHKELLCVVIHCCSDHALDERAELLATTHPLPALLTKVYVRTNVAEFVVLLMKSIKTSAETHDGVRLVRLTRARGACLIYNGLFLTLQTPQTPLAFCKHHKYRVNSAKLRCITHRQQIAN